MKETFRKEGIKKMEKNKDKAKKNNGPIKYVLSAHEQ